MIGDHIGGKYSNDPAWVFPLRPNCYHQWTQMPQLSWMMLGRKQSLQDVLHCLLRMLPVICGGCGVLLSSLTLLQTTLSPRCMWLKEPRLVWTFYGGGRKCKCMASSSMLRNAKGKTFSTQQAKDPENVRYWVKLLITDCGLLQWQKVTLRWGEGEKI